jgi:hypothetical protein
VLVAINWKPSRRELRKFGLTLLVLFPLFGAFLAWRLGRMGIFYGCAGVGVLVELLVLCVPRAAVWVYKGWMGLALVLGTVVGPVVMALVYYGVLTPIALVLRARGNDPLQRCRKPAGESYWMPLEHRTDVRSYERQF